MGKAISYFIDEYEALKGYLRDPRYRIDNNLIENAIRPTAVGRNYPRFAIMQGCWRAFKSENEDEAVIDSLDAQDSHRPLCPLPLQSITNFA